MSTRPIIFISSVSKELSSTRKLVAETLYTLGYDPKSEDNAPTAAGEIPTILRQWIDQSDAVLQLVGHCYGLPLAPPHPQFGPCSHTQYEAHYAHQKGKKVYYILLDPAHPTDGCACQPQTLHDLQAHYRQSVKDKTDLYHSTSSLTQTELLVRRLRDELAELRAEGQKQQRALSKKIALVLGLLVVLVLGGYFLLRGQQHTDVIVTKSAQQLDQQAQALADLRQMLETSIKGGSESRLTADYDAALRFIASKRGLSLPAFRAFLEQNATQALGDATVSLKDKVRALQEAGQFVQARDFALEHARRLETERHQNSKEEVELWTEAAKTELTLGHYDKALEYATKAVAQTDPKADFPTWSAARHQQGRALSYVRKDKEAQALYEELIPLQVAAFGQEVLAVLQSRRALAISFYDQGSYALAEQQDRALVADCQRVLGAEHPDTLSSRMNLANALHSQARYAEAEQEHRARIKIEERVLGAEHPDVALSCFNLALCLEAQHKLPEALQFMQRAELVWTKVLGPDHPYTKDAKAVRERLEAALK